MKTKFILFASLLFLFAMAVPQQGTAIEIETMYASTSSDGNGGHYLQMTAVLSNNSNAPSATMIFEVHGNVIEETVSGSQNHQTVVFHFPRGLSGNSIYAKCTVCEGGTCLQDGCDVVIVPN